jgi:hypothetical protein
MTQLVLNIPDDKLPLVRLLAKELNFVVVNEKKTTKKLTAKQQKWVDDFGQALHEVDLHTQGKIKLKTAQQLLDEL